MTVLDTATLEFLASGSHRRCYLHPEHAYRCIKVAYRPEGETESLRELRQHRLLARRPGFDYDGLARLYGVLPTSEGLGRVHELVCNQTDGRPAPTLIEAFTTEALAEDAARWQQAIRRFRRWLARHAVIATDMTPQNLCVVTEPGGTLRLVLIDGLGHKDPWPLVDYLRPLARLRMRRHVHRRGLDDLSVLRDRVDYYRNELGRGRWRDPDAPDGTVQ